MGEESSERYECIPAKLLVIEDVCKYIYLAGWNDWNSRGLRRTLSKSGRSSLSIPRVTWSTDPAITFPACQRTAFVRPTVN
jgi:hypothetical protein